MQTGVLVELADGTRVPGVNYLSGEVVALTTSSAQSSAAPAGAVAAEIWFDAASYFALGANPTASTTTGSLPANIPRLVKLVYPGSSYKIAARTVSGTGNMYVNWI